MLRGEAMRVGERGRERGRGVIVVAIIVIAYAVIIGVDTLNR